MILPTLRPFPWLALSFFGFFCSYGVFMPFFPTWLKEQHYGTETIGILMASAYIFRFLGSMLFTRMIKRPPQLLTALRYLAWVSCAIMLFISVSAKNFPLLCLGLWLFSLVNSAGIPLSDTLATTWQFQVKLDYGRVRLIGSLAFAVGVTLFGNMIGILGEQSIIWFVIALLFCYALVQMFPPSLMPANAQENHDTSLPSPTLWQLFKQPNIRRIIIAVALIQGSHAGYYVYSVIYWTHLGLALQGTSVLWGLSVLIEVVFFFFASRLFKNWSVRNLFYFSAIVATVRWACFPYAQTFAEILPLQALHALSFALNHFAMVRYIASQPHQSIANLQGLYNAIAGCAGVALLSLLSGWLYPISPTATFLAMAGFAGLAVFVLPRHLANYGRNE